MTGWKIIAAICFFSLAGSIGTSRDAAAACLLCTCSASAQAASFGTYDPNASGSDDTAGQVTVSCSTLSAGKQTVAYQINLSAGGGGNLANRRMSSGVNKLSYNLYIDNARQRIWGDGTGSSSVVSDSGSIALLGGLTRNYPVYARIPAKQNVRAGIYVDTITVSVIY